MASTNPPFATLDEWLHWQETTPISEIELGLQRCRSVAQRLAISTGEAIIVSVAGTNGKGSSVAMLEKIWRGQGYKVATYSSPHMIEYNERIRFNSEVVSSEEICAAFEQIHAACGDTYLTYFEYGTLAALLIFQALQPDVIILEVGLGGRLDAVNIIDANVALITSIGIDHVEYLGDNRELIGREKAGIMRPSRPAICSDPAVPATVIAYANEIGADLSLLGVAFRYSDNGESWDWWSGETKYCDLPKPNLVGDYQLQNAAGVLQAVAFLNSRLPVTQDVIAEALKKITLWGRFQRIMGEVEYILDVAHNAQAIDKFVSTLATLPGAKRTHLVLGMLKGKDHLGVMSLLAPMVDCWHLASVPGRRGANSEELFHSLELVSPGERGVRRYDSVHEALDNVAESAQRGDRVVALGSFLVVSEVLKYLKWNDT